MVRIFAAGYAVAPGSTSPTQVYFAGGPGPKVFSGPLIFGLWQINAVVPAGISGQAPLFIAERGMTSNAVTVNVQ